MATNEATEVRASIAAPAVQEKKERETLREVIERIRSKNSQFKAALEESAFYGTAFGPSCNFMTYDAFVRIVNMVGEGMGEDTDQDRKDLIRARLESYEASVSASTFAWWTMRSMVDFYGFDPREFRWGSYYNLAAESKAYELYCKRVKERIDLILHEHSSGLQNVLDDMGVTNDEFAVMRQKGACYHKAKYMAEWFYMPMRRPLVDIENDNNFQYLVLMVRLLSLADARYQAWHQRGANTALCPSEFIAGDIPRSVSTCQKVTAKLQKFEHCIGKNLVKIISDGLDVWTDSTLEVIPEEKRREFLDRASVEFREVSYDKYAPKTEVVVKTPVIPTVELDDAVEYLKSMLSKYEDVQHIRDFIDKITDVTLREDCERALAAFLARNPITSRKVENVEPRF